MSPERETRRLAAAHGHKGSIKGRAWKKITLRRIVNRVALRIDMMIDDKSAAFEMMDSENVRDMGDKNNPEMFQQRSQVQTTRRIPRLLWSEYVQR